MSDRINSLDSYSDHSVVVLMKSVLAPEEFDKWSYNICMLSMYNFVHVGMKLDNATDKKPPDVIFKTLAWDNTYEGHEYWSDLSERLYKELTCAK